MNPKVALPFNIFTQVLRASLLRPWLCCGLLFLGLVFAPALHAQQNWLSGVNVLSTTVGTSTDSDVIDNATLVVTNGGNLTAGILNVGPTNRGVLTLLTNASINVQTLLVTNVVCNFLTNSVFNITGPIGSTLTTSNYNGLASTIIQATNVSLTVNANWNMNAGTNIIENVSTNAGGAAVYLGNIANNLSMNINSNAVLWLAIPANSRATNIMQLTIGTGNATNNVLTVNGGALIATNYTGSTDPVIVGNSSGSTSNQMIITNGGFVSTICYGAANSPAGLIGNVGAYNSLIVAGTNSAGQKSLWTVGKDRFYVGNGNGPAGSSNNWVRVDQGLSLIHI